MRELVASGAKVSEVAFDLEISEQTIEAWLQQDWAVPTTAGRWPAGKYSSLSCRLESRPPLRQQIPVGPIRRSLG